MTARASQQPIAIPDPKDVGPSSNNTAVIASYGTITITLPSITDTNFATLVTFLPSLFSDLTSLYRITFNYQYTSVAFTGLPIGTLNLYIQDGAGIEYANSVVPVRQAIPNNTRNIGGSMSFVFRPVSGLGTTIGLQNDSGATVNASGTLLINSMCIEKVTTAFTTGTTAASFFQ